MIYTQQSFYPRYGRYEFACMFAMEACVLVPVVVSRLINVPSALFNTIHLSAFTFLFGMQFWFTFIAGKYDMSSEIYFLKMCPYTFSMTRLCGNKQ